MLIAMRQLIHNIVPEAVETLSYGITTFRLKRKCLMGYGGFKNHCALYLNPFTLTKFSDDLKGIKTSKGSIRFTSGEELPQELITKVINYHVHEHINRINQ